MRKVMSKMVFGLALASLFVACDPEPSSDVNQDKIHTVYEVFYNSNSDKTWVIAQFRFGGPTGTVLELEDPASVTFEGDILPYNAAFAGHFKEFAGQIDSGTFVYTDVDNEVFENSLPAYEEIAFPQDIDTISQSAAYDLIWDGTPLAVDQRVGLFVGSWDWGNDALFLQTNEGADNIVLGTNQLSNVTLGQSTMYMDRTTEVEVAQGTSEGGKIRGKFRATNVEVVIVE